MLPSPLCFVHMSYCVPVGGCLPLSQLSLPASCSSAGRPRHRPDHPWCTCYASHRCMRGGCPSCHLNNTRVVFFLDNYSLEKDRGLWERWRERLIWCQWWNVIFFVAKIWCMFTLRFLTEQKKIVMKQSLGSGWMLMIANGLSRSCFTFVHICSARLVTMICLFRVHLNITMLFLHKLVLMSSTVLARFLLLETGQFNSGNVQQTGS